MILDQYDRPIAMAATPTANGNSSLAREMQLIVNDLITSRNGLMMQQLLDPRRDIDAECHYPKTPDLTPGGMNGTMPQGIIGRPGH